MNEEHLFEIINPSDPYTIKGSRIACATAALLVGHGRLGLRRAGDNTKAWDTGLPVFLFNGIKAVNNWFYEQFQAPDFSEWAIAHRLEVAAVCDSVMIGDADDRTRFEAGLAALPTEEAREALRKRWNAENRTSLTDYSSAFRHLAEKLREAHAQDGAAPTG